ncbi:hypothetical protein HRD49_38340 [Corallococcus exiguus]|uniref:hypothetical protein n=1 Tax=Corallococcus exiguus TaxID=83462 RepID=UPI0015604080|nr:hypothetical protein [Corallococcus exiguus]NRD67608.1 hypothetical protein [Corallococcus exiguus]
MRDLAAGLAALLESAGLGLVRPPVPGANLFSAPMPESDGIVPVRAVAVVMTGGAKPQPYMGKEGSVYLVPSWQVRIRSAREDFESGQQLAYDVFKALNLSILPPCAVVRVEESSPIYLGVNGGDLHSWCFSLSIGFFDV